MKTITKLWIFIILLVLLTPLGLIIPARFNAGTAWGEWGAGELKRLAGYLPRGFAKLASLWEAPIQGYAIGHQGAPYAYILSAIIGVLVTTAIAYLIGRFLTRKN